MAKKFETEDFVYYDRSLTPSDIRDLCDKKSKDGFCNNSDTRCVKLNGRDVAIHVLHFYKEVQPMKVEAVGLVHGLPDFHEIFTLKRLDSDWNFLHCELLRQFNGKKVKITIEELE